MSDRPWQLYPLHVEALVWESPVLVGDNKALRATAGEALYLWARIPVGDEPLSDMYHRAERHAYRSLLAYMSGYTGGSDGPAA